MAHTGEMQFMQCSLSHGAHFSRMYHSQAEMTRSHLCAPVLTLGRGFGGGGGWGVSVACVCGVAEGKFQQLEATARL